MTRASRESPAVGGARALAFAVAVAATPLLAGCFDKELVPIRAIGGPSDGGVGPCSDQMVGFAAQGPPDGGTTTGGVAGATVTVNTLADLQSNAGDDAALIIRLDGMLTLSEQVKVKPNKTIIGVGATSGLLGGGFNLTDANNVILRNLIIAKVVGNDAVSVSRAQNIWIDHCDLSSDRNHGKDYYDGLVDITHGSDYVTVSWTQFRDHFQTSIIGAADVDPDATEDMGHLNVTFEHNLFLRTYSHNPSIRFGHLHAFNNYYLTIDGGAIFSRMNAQVLAEGNYFDGVTLPLATHYDSPTDGFITNENNTFVNSADPQIGQTSTWTPTYDYRAQLAADVPGMVTACAGVGKLGL
jgi:pectate lyase